MTASVTGILISAEVNSFTLVKNMAASSVKVNVFCSFAKKTLFYKDKREYRSGYFVSNTLY
jgi:hypothetical protein